MTKSLDLTALCLFFALAIPSLSVAAQDGAGADDNIIVPGEAIGEPSTIREQVRRMVDLNRADRPAPRYFDRLCLNVSGLNRAGNDYVRQRVAGHAQRVGLALDEDADCPANALILVHDDPAELVRRIKDDLPTLLPRELRKVVDEQVTAGRPIVVWHNEEPRDLGGRPMPYTSLGGVLRYDTRTSNNNWPGRTELGFSQGVVSGVVILDADIVAGMEIDRFADYAAMRLLAPGLTPLEDGMPEPDSIIAPFPDEEGPETLTRFDRAYLSGLYSLPPNAPAPRLVAAVEEAYESDR